MVDKMGEHKITLQIRVNKELYAELLKRKGTLRTWEDLLEKTFLPEPIGDPLCPKCGEFLVSTGKGQWNCRNETCMAYVVVA